MTTEEARTLVYRIVIGWLSRKLSLPVEKIEIGRTFRDAPPDGYRQSRGAFNSMCDSITTSLNKYACRSLILDGQWRIDHAGDTISKFMNSAALALLAAPESTLCQASNRWGAAVPANFGPPAAITATLKRKRTATSKKKVVS